MKKILLILFLLCWATPVWGAAGDIVSARIDSTGWFMTITIAGADTGGVYDFELGASGHDPTNAKVKLTLTSQGYDSTGTLGTVVRTIIGDCPKRKPYPTEMLEDETGYGASDSVSISIALQEWVFVDDTSITLTLDDSLYTQGAVISAAAVDLAVTNASAQPYSAAKVIANWAWPGFSRITSTSLTVRAAAFHRSAAGGKPVESVKFWVDDKSGHRDSTMVYRATSDTTRGDAVPVTEFTGTLNLTAMTDGDSLVVNFIAYPRVGDEGAILDTSDGVNASPSPLYCPQIYIYDLDKSLGVVAVVDSATGVDANGATVAESSFDSENPPVTYLTVDGAIDDGANIIYMKAGTYKWTGGFNTATSTFWKEIRVFPGVTRAAAIFDSVTGDKDVGPFCKFYGVTLTSDVAFVSGTQSVWVDSCVVNDTTTQVFFYNVGQLYITRNTFSSMLMLRPYGIQTKIALLRGNTINTITENIHTRVVIGNRIIDVRNVGTYVLYGVAVAGDTTPNTGAIIAYNFITSKVARILDFANTFTITHGLSVVQNVFERWSGAANVVQLAGDGTRSTTSPANNVLFWNNTVIGQRINIWYNDYAMNDSLPPIRYYNQFKNNIIDDINIVTDKDGHGGTPDDNRIGNHSVIHGVGLSGNIEFSRKGVPADFRPKFWGLYSVAYMDSTNPLFVDDNSAAEGATGSGDYRLQSGSLAQGIAGEVLLPFDIQGHPRNLTAAGDAGAYDDYVPESGEEEAGYTHKRLFDSGDITPWFNSGEIINIYEP